MDIMKLASKPKSLKNRKRVFKIQNIYTESILSKNTNDLKDLNKRENQKDMFYMASMNSGLAGWMKKINEYLNTDPEE